MPTGRGGNRSSKQRGKPVVRARTTGWPDSRGLDGNAPWLLLGALRDGDFQHPVHVPGLDRLGIGALRKGEAAQERARGALDALETVRGRLLLRAALAADRQHALVGGDLDVLAFDARHVGDHYEALGFLADVHMRDPADARGIRAVSTLAHGAIELLLEAVQERPRLVTNDGHNCSPVGMSETKRKCCAVAPDVWLTGRAFKSANAARWAARAITARSRSCPSRRRTHLPGGGNRRSRSSDISRGNGSPGGRNSCSRSSFLWAGCAKPVSRLGTRYWGQSLNRQPGNP